MEIFLCVMAAAALFIAACLLAAAVDSRRLERSLMATFAEWYMRLCRGPKYLKRAVRELGELKAAGESRYKLPCRVKSEVLEYCSSGLQVFEFNPGGSGGTVLAFYGGGYVHRPLAYHIKFYDRLALSADCRIVMPVMPRAPFASFRQAYAAAQPLYMSLAARSPVILLGDSSGGGFALGLTLKLRDEGAPLPRKLILLAPWTDLTMSNPRIRGYESADPRNSRALAALWAQAWADGEDLTCSLLSPAFGRLSGLPPVVQYAGTRDILYPDCELLHEKLLAAGSESRFVAGRGLNHVYPVYPIPEARVALGQIVSDIRGGEGEPLGCVRRTRPSPG